MSLQLVFPLLGGLGLFIYGMKQMSEGLQKVAGKKLRHFLAILTTRPLVGVLVGTLVTAIIQSSSATTVMVVGFVNAGLMTLSQSIGVIMGANIGTTVTAQIVAFKLGDYAFHTITIGAFAYLFSRNQKIQYLGQVLLGFGILFLGLNTMSDTMKPLRDSVYFLNLMENFSSYPLLGVLAGMLVTMVIQSSSATFGILLGLVSVGAITYQAGIPILLGSNIGTTITAILSSIGANRSAKRAAAAHFIFNVLGAGIVIVLIYVIPDFTDSIHQFLIKLSNLFGHTPTSERLLANTHTLFNVLNTLLWLPFVGFMVKIVKSVLPGDEVAVKRGLNYLDERMLKTPSLALNQLKKEVIRMYGITQEMVRESIKIFKEGHDSKIVKAVHHKEDIINEIEEDLIKFISSVPRNSLSGGDLRVLNMYYAIIDDIESIADDAVEMVELGSYSWENNLKYSDEAWKSLNENFDLIFDLIESSYEMVETENLELSTQILDAEDKMDQYQLENRNCHLKRLGSGICEPGAGIVYLEILDRLEHISDQAADIAHSMTEAL
ncbi:Na/Pi cotransporter family protein [Halothermothrix orenii]|uniref:Na/Pi-cotransporter II-related protein n=1 Tax=Halothermothrix orenii (strain H 168 / OCM 544 / DSM 9562) TaxID=373903 RepID=B8D0H5_HALOH|nr:Na/Pi cotransporter family protein [Halothermothrix orenii]ACL70911.1 Na/Pi-cotransporter II-related protein [Halothermothrix orenii H 168]